MLEINCCKYISRESWVFGVVHQRRRTGSQCGCQGQSCQHGPCCCEEETAVRISRKQERRCSRRRNVDAANNCWRSSLINQDWRRFRISNHCPPSFRTSDNRAKSPICKPDRSLWPSNHYLLHFQELVNKINSHPEGSGANHKPRPEQERCHVC